MELPKFDNDEVRYVDVVKKKVKQAWQPKNKGRW